MKQLYLFAASGLIVAPVHCIEMNVEQERHRLDSTETISVYFSEQMVDEDQIGEAVKEGGISLTPSLPYEAVWLNEAQLRITMPDKLAYRSKHKLKVTTSYGTAEGEIVNKSNDSYHSISLLTEDKDYSPLYIYVNSQRALDERFISYIKKAYYEVSYPHDLSRAKQQVPANLRQLTVGEVLSDSHLCERFRWKISDAEWAAFQQLPADLVVPVLWKVDSLLPTGKDSDKAHIELFIPEIDSYDEENKRFKDRKIASIIRDKKGYSLYLSELMDGRHQVNIYFASPVEVPQDWDDIFSQLSWKQLYEDELSYPFVHRGEGRYVSEIMTKEEKEKLEQFSLDSDDSAWNIFAPLKGDIELSFDRESNEKNIYEMTLPNGDKKRFISKLVFNVKGGTHGCSLMLSSAIKDVFGQVPKPISDDRESASFALVVPDIKMDVDSGVLPASSKRQFSIQHAKHGDMRLRVLRYKNTGADAVRVLAGYLNYQSSDDTRRALGYGRPTTLRKDASIMEHLRNQEQKNFFPSDIVANEASRVIPIREGSGTQVYSLLDKELYPEDNSGLYLIEAIARELDSNEKLRATSSQPSIAAAQGIAQLTNLGLFWKTDASMSQLFAYGYHLDTGAALRHPKLSLYDAAAQLLHEQDLSPSGSVLDIKSLLGERVHQIEYIQISDGKDGFTSPFFVAGSSTDVYHHGGGRGIAQCYPTLIHYTFSDRPLYRPGETAHVKGFIRQHFEDQVTIPSKDFVEGLQVSLQRGGVEIMSFETPIEDDGSFSYDIDIPQDEEMLGYYVLSMRVMNKTDRNFASPDMIAMGLGSKKLYLNKKRSVFDFYQYESILRSNREFQKSLLVEHYRRNEFDIKGETSFREAENQIQVRLSAHSYSGAPLANAQVELSVHAELGNFYPKGLRAYRFGDHREDDSELLDAYFLNRDSLSLDYCRGEAVEEAFDENGQSTLSLELPELSFPLRQRLRAMGTVTNANQQTLPYISQPIELHPADYYIGIKQKSQFSEASSKPMDLELQLVDTEGKTVSTKKPVRLTVTRKQTNKYSILSHMLPDESKEELVCEESIMLDSAGKATFDMPREKAGIYIITVSGTDEKGREYRSAIKHQVWSATRTDQEKSLSIIADKNVYEENEPVKLLIKAPLEGEVILAIGREGKMRHQHHKLTADHPLIELHLDKEDSPTVRISATMIQPGEKNHSGQPKLYTDDIVIYIDPDAKRLQVSLDLPSTSSAPRESSQLSGQVRDAHGAPVADASLLVYVVDEGALQAGGYQQPDLIKVFHHREPLEWKHYSSLSSLLSNDLSKRPLMNSKTFIESQSFFYARSHGGLSSGSSGGLGQGMSWGADAGQNMASMIMRDNFDPCPLWQTCIKTDSEGRFSVSVKNPDTLTRYRVIAVANHGSDRFGIASGFYDVNKSIMLEGSAPYSACKGDVIELPITVSMNPEELPEQWMKEGSMKWKLQLKGNDIVAIDQPEQTVSLHGDTPLTTTFTVSMQKLGEARFEWIVTPLLDDAKATSLHQDALAESFSVRPATPYLRESQMSVLPAGSDSTANKWVRSEFAPEQTRLSLTLSPSPLSGYTLSASMLRDYPFDCTEQLSSRILPLLYADLFHEASGVPLMDEEKRKALIGALVSQVMRRRSWNMLFSYWAHDRAASIFSPYIAIVLSRVHEKGVNGDRTSAYQQLDFNQIKQQLLEDSEQNSRLETMSNVLWLYLLSAQAELSAEDFHRVIKKYADTWVSVQERWIIALSACILDEKLAETFIQDAMIAESKFSDQEIFYLPDTETVKLLLRIHRDAASLETAQLVNNYVNKRSNSISMSTYQHGWMSILLADYIKLAKLQSPEAMVNGRVIKSSRPLVFSKTPLAELPRIQVAAQSDPVYATYTVEGFLKDEQKEQFVDEGFLVQRRYEKYHTDGNWKPASEFRVGDIVRVFVTAKPREMSQYVVLEDYLPAGMEAVNPAVSGQYLPLQLRSNSSKLYSYSSWVSRKLYLKDRVRFFVTQWKDKEMLEVSYLARVTKAGTMKAPAAKAEEMYRPQVYGLSIPLNLKIQP